MEIRVQRDDHAVLLARQLDDLPIACSAVAEISDMAGTEIPFLEVSHGAARQTLVEQQPNHAAPKVMT